MSFLIDTNIFIGIINQTLRITHPRLCSLVSESDASLSVASIWEIAIKVRIGKLTIPVSPSAITRYCEQIEIAVLTIEADHATATLDIAPETNDPFDRLLLCQCQVEAKRLVTLDRALLKHPLAYRGSL
jgi:PIN domain nuclease of toxin-antitoxin system